MNILSVHVSAKLASLRRSQCEPFMDQNWRWQRYLEVKWNRINENIVPNKMTSRLNIVKSCHMWFVCLLSSLCTLCARVSLALRIHVTVSDSPPPAHHSPAVLFCWSKAEFDIERNPENENYKQNRKEQWAVSALCQSHQTVWVSKGLTFFLQKHDMELFKCKAGWWMVIETLLTYLIQQELWTVTYSFMLFSCTLFLLPSVWGCAPFYLFQSFADSQLSEYVKIHLDVLICSWLELLHVCEKPLFIFFPLLSSERVGTTFWFDRKRKVSNFVRPLLSVLWGHHSFSSIKRSDTTDKIPWVCWASGVQPLTHFPPLSLFIVFTDPYLASLTLQFPLSVYVLIF